MDSQYYHPQLKEIHHGFEFQYLNPATEQWTVYNWSNPRLELTIGFNSITICGFKMDKSKLRAKQKETIEV